MEKRFVLGIDIGGTETKIGLVSEEGEILRAEKFKTNAKEPFEFFLTKLEAVVKTILTDLAQNKKIIGIGVGAPNANTRSGNMEHPPNFKWGETVPLISNINRIFQLPVVIANDANASALGELKFGMGKDMSNFVVITLGTGLGSGIISNGALLIGEHGMAGELGHVNVNSDNNARQCNCGLKGCLETYVSVTGMRRTIFELISEMTDESILRSISYDDMTGEIISDAALNGDKIALHAFEQTGKILGIQIADTAAHLDPEAFILLGGLTNAGDILLKPIVDYMNQNLFTAYKGKVKVLISPTPGAHAVLGPAALAWQNFRKNSS